MKKYKFIMAILPIGLMAQPIIKNAENFSVGTVLKFMNCKAENVEPGKSGAKQTWDFSKLETLKDTLTEWMVDPAKTPQGDIFPNSNLAEKYSDGRYVYLENKEKQSFLNGFVEERKKIFIKYPDPVLIAQRPFIFGKTITDKYSEEFTVNNLDFVGSGTATLSADAYGTLILPNGKYNNVLRVKIIQSQKDTLTQYNNISTTVSSSYIWFDETHTSALLKIDATDSGTYKSKSVEYLISEVKGPELK